MLRYAIIIIMKYSIVQRSTGKEIAQAQNEIQANELVNILESMYGVLDIQNK